MGEPTNKRIGHAFISYAREDSDRVNQLQRGLEDAGIPVWRDTSHLWPGEDWRTKIKQAITEDALVFISCFSFRSLSRVTGFQNEELVLAIEQLRQRRPDEPWIIPVRFDECTIPDWDLGVGRTLHSIQRADLFGDGHSKELARLIEVIWRMLGRPTTTTQDDPPENSQPRTQPRLPATQVQTSSPTFQVTTIPIARYDFHSPLDQVSADIANMTKTLSEFGGTVEHPTTAEDYFDQSHVRDRLHEWVSRTAGGGLLIWLGRGDSDGTDAWLACSDTPFPIKGNGIVPHTIADQINNDWWRRAKDDTAWSIVVIEACGAATFVRNLLPLVAKHNPHRLALVGVSDDRSTYTGRLGNALENAINSYTVNDESIRLRDFISRLEDFLQPDDLVLQLRIGGHLVVPRRRLINAPVSAPIDIHSALVVYLAALSPDERSHFIPKSQGAEYGELAWYFVGRTAERRRISSWLRENVGGMLIVTGRAGAGKSALLGNLRVYADPALRELLIQGGHLEWVAEPDRPPDNIFDAVLHLAGVTTTELVRRMADAAGVSLPVSEGVESGQDLETLIDRIRDRRFTILIDALDEAQEPATIASTVLRRLAGLPFMRILVGTRASTKEGPDQPQTTDQDLIDALGRATATIMHVERDPAAISSYIERRLIAALGEVRQQSSGTTVEEVVTLIGRSDREFLFARLAVHEIIARPELLSAACRTELEALLRGDHRTLFGAAVARLTGRSPAVKPLLEALALSRGRGVPRADRVWALMASAIVGIDVAVHEAEIEELVTAAAPYIMLDAEDGQSVYRLAHRTFQEYFMRPEISGDDASVRLRDSNRRIARMLIRNARNAGAVNAYVVRRVAEHVAAGEIWEELAEETFVLDQLDPDSIAAEALRTAFGRADLPLAIAASLSARHLLSAVKADDRATTRNITMACLESGIAARPADSSATGAWAQLQRRDPLHVILAGHSGAVRAVTSLQLPDGRVLLASAGEDASARLWDLSTGRPVGEPLHGPHGPVLGIATLRSEGRALLVSACHDGSLQLWDPDSGQPQGGSLAGHSGAILTVLSVSDNAHGEVLITGGFDRKLTSWTIATGRPISRSVLSAGYRAATAATISVGRDRVLLVTGGFDAAVRVWDPFTGEQVAEPLTDATGTINSVATLTLPDGQPVVAAGDIDGSLWLWNPVTGRLLGPPLADSTGTIYSVAAFTLPDGQPVVAAGGNDGAINLWDPLAGVPAGEPLTGHQGPVRAMTTVRRPDGRILLASGGQDGTVRLWDPTPVRHAKLASERRGGRVLTAVPAALSDGRVVVATGDDDGMVELWDQRTGTPIGTAITSDTSAIHALTAIPRIKGGTLLAAGGADGSVTLWDIDGGLRIGEPHPLHTGAITAMCMIQRDSGPISLASAGNDDKISLWQPLSGELEGLMMGTHGRTVNALAVVPAPDGSVLLASAGDNAFITLWNLETYTSTYSLMIPGVRSFASLAIVSAEPGAGSIVAAGDEGVVFIWDIKDLGRTARSLAIGSSVLSMTPITSPTGAQLLAVSSADRRIRMCDVSHMQVLHTFPLPFDLCAQKVVATDSKLIFCTDNGLIVCPMNW